MPDLKLDAHETGLLAAFDAGEFVPVTDETELDMLRSAAHATGARDRRVSIDRG